MRDEGQQGREGQGSGDHSYGGAARQPHLESSPRRINRDSRIKEGERDLKLYFEKGRLAYADGIDKEGPLLVELVSKGKISLKQLDEFRVISQKDPLSLGQALLVRKSFLKPCGDNFFF